MREKNYNKHLIDICKNFILQRENSSTEISVNVKRIVEWEKKFIRGQPNSITVDDIIITSSLLFIFRFDVFLISFFFDHQFDDLDPFSFLTFLLPTKNVKSEISIYHSFIYSFIHSTNFDCSKWMTEYVDHVQTLFSIHKQQQQQQQ